MFLSISFQKIPGVKREIEREREREREREEREREGGREAERQRERERETASEHCGPPEVVLSCEVCVWVPLMVCA